MLKDELGREILNKSNISFTGDYCHSEYSCEICKTKHKFSDMLSCDRCQRFVCDNCSETVANWYDNPFEYDFLCSECLEELMRKE